MWNSEERDRFWNDVLQASRSIALDEGEVQKYIRERGLRILVETTRPMSSEDVRKLVSEALGRPEDYGIELLVEPLFEADGETPPTLILFHAVIIPGVDPARLEESPYDACYAILEITYFQSAEPDIAFQRFLGASLVTTGAASAQTRTDKAWALRQMNVDRAWGLPPPPSGQSDGDGVAIAHLDSGYVVHDDLDQVNFDPKRKADFIRARDGAVDPMLGAPVWSPGHGTRTGSVMMSRGGVDASPTPASAGTTPPGDITGVARRVSYVPVRCIRSVVVIYAGDIARGVYYAKKEQCHVVSMSLGGFRSKGLHQAIKVAVKDDLLVIAAAGNHIGLVVYPARYPECIAMAASNVHEVPWSGSSRGIEVDLTAPGEDVWVAEPTRPTHGTATGSGTSYATAHMAGVAALWLAFYGRAALLTLAARNQITLQELFRQHVMQTARTPKSGWDKTRYGTGIVDAYKLLSTPFGFQFDSTSSPNAASTTSLSHIDLPSVLNFIFTNHGFPSRIAWRQLEPLESFEHELSTLDMGIKTGNPRPTVSRKLLARVREAN